MFGHHFARMGQEVYRLDRHPVMARHPVTPMNESELVRILKAQNFAITELVDLRLLDQYADHPPALAEHLQQYESAVFDSYSVEHITTAAAVLWHMSHDRQICAMAAQGFAFGLGRFLRLSGLIDTPAPTHQLQPVDRLLVLSGSCSALSALQIERAKQSGFIGLRLDIGSILNATAPWLATLRTQVVEALKSGKSLVVYTATGPEDPSIRNTQQNVLSDQTDPAFLAEKIGKVFGELAQAAIKEAGLKRLVVSGGDSSSFTMRALHATALEVQASHFVQNAHVCRLRSTDPAIHGTEVLLKGGQVGAEDLYDVMRKGFVT
jgi:uncharacterized protein YgbK (DUF1537 family)